MKSIKDFDWYTEKHLEAENRLFKLYGNDWFFFPVEDAKKLIEEEIIKNG